MTEISLKILDMECAACVARLDRVISRLHGVKSAQVNFTAFIENAHKTDTVIFDKTGTITKGNPEVTEIIVLDGRSEKELVRLCASAEVLADHPVANAVVEWRKGMCQHQNVSDGISYAGESTFFIPFSSEISKIQ